MWVKEGKSTNQDAKEAVDEITQNWKIGPNDLDIIFTFHSMKQDPNKVLEHLSRKFPNTPIAGCTTAGEHITGGHSNESLVVCGLHTPKVKWSVGVIDDLANVNPQKCKNLIDNLFDNIKVDSSDLNPQKHFAIIFPDGMSGKEEHLCASMLEALEGIPMIGGSAGDDLQFKKTWVLANDKAYSNACTVIVGESEVGFHIHKHQHFKETEKELVATEVDSEKRIIKTFDGYPAAQRYAEVLGLRVDELTPQVFSDHPITFAVNGQIYVRSIQQKLADDSLAFYCGVEEGMVFRLGGHEDMVHALEKDLSKLQDEKFEFTLVCNCILRSLEASAAKKQQKLGEKLTKFSSHIIGFDTYGEQLNGLHINQTIVSLSLKKSA